ncbi:MAG: phosphomannomutase/phosphoglucomutase [Candidatus Aenigmatarchaeota archaeon]
MSIFRAYDIRGVYGKDITENVMKGIGNAFGNYVKGGVVLARDCRLSSPSLKESFVKGFIETGKNVVDCGEIPLGAGMFYAWKTKAEFAYITASHLPSEWNGVKFFHSNGIGFLEEENMKVRDLYLNGPVVDNKYGKVFKPKWDVLSGYKRYLLSKTRPKRRIKVVLDCGNGMAGMIAPDLFREAGFDVETIFEKPDGKFPNRNPDPMEDPLEELKKMVKKADFGIAYDGDGDRMVVVDNEGKKLTPEQTSFFILTELLKSRKGPVVANVECTRAIDDVAKRFKRHVKRVRVGHTFLMEAAKRYKACFGVEVSGHYVIPSIVPFDDSLAVSFYFASVLSGKKQPLSEEIKNVPVYPFERVSFECPDQKKFEVVENMKRGIIKKYRKVNFMDGIRIDMENGWVLIRPSNTSPLIRLTVEGVTEKEKEGLKKSFSDMLKKEIGRV